MATVTLLSLRADFCCATITVVKYHTSPALANSPKLLLAMNVFLVYKILVKLLVCF